MDEKKKNRRSIKSFLNGRKGAVLISAICFLLILLMAIFSMKMQKKAATHEESGNEESDTEVWEDDVSSSPDDVLPESTDDFHAVIIEEIDPNEPSVAIEYVPGAQFTYENSSVVSVPNAARYLNHTVTAEVGYGMHLTLGADSADDVSGLFINPRFSYDYISADPITSRHGVYFFILSCTNGNILYSARSSGPYGDINNQGKTELFVVGRTYDDLKPAAYRDEANYGALWQSEPGLFPEADQSWKLSIRVIRADDGFLMAIAHADINYNSESNTYSLGGLYPADVVKTGELDEIIRDAAVTRALAFLANENCKLDIGLDFEELAYNQEFICVERVQRPYYSKLFFVNGDVVNATSVMKYQLYAVNIPLYGYGYFTVYMAPQEQVASPFASLPTELTELAVVGYDAKSPFSVFSFNAALREADREEFNVIGG